MAERNHVRTTAPLPAPESERRTPDAGPASRVTFAPITPETALCSRPGNVGRAGIVLALEGVRGNVTHAAQKLGLAHETLYRLLRVHSIGRTD